MSDFLLSYCLLLSPLFSESALRPSDGVPIELSMMNSAAPRSNKGPRIAFQRFRGISPMASNSNEQGLLKAFAAIGVAVAAGVILGAGGAAFGSMVGVASVKQELTDLSSKVTDGFSSVNQRLDQEDRRIDDLTHGGGHGR